MRSLSPEQQIMRFFQLLRILADEQLELGERVAKLYGFLFEKSHPERRATEAPGTPSTTSLESWDQEQLERALHFASEIIVRYTELYYDPSLLPVTYYRRQRRVSEHLERILSPILREHVRRTGAPPVQDLFLNEPIFYMKKEARTRAYPKNKRGRINLDFLRERFRLTLMHRTAA